MKITFFTTSTFSDIQEYQTACIRKFFPQSQHIKFDGRSGWFSVWYRWLDYSMSVDSDWYVHIDEDCFITSADQILELISDMEKDGIDIAGPPDGHFEYRSGNHMALNAFFMVMNRRCIEAWANRGTIIPQFREEWIEEYPFDKRNGTRYEYDMEFGSSGKPLGMIWKPETEPYYDFFWVLKDAGLKFRYLEPVFGEELQTTDLLAGSVTHLWHQRERFADYLVSPLHSMTNRNRYELMIDKIKKTIL
jgi:hypothetical protein